MIWHITALYLLKSVLCVFLFPFVDGTFTVHLIMYL